MHTHHIIRDRLRKELDRRGLTAMELARDAGVKTSFIYDILNGKSTNPSTVKLAMVAESLDVNLAWLAGGPESAQQGGAGHMAAIRQLAGSEAADKDAVYAHFSRAWIREALGTAPSLLRALTLSGESMEPALRDGDLLLIDTNRTQPSPPGIFVLSDGVAPIARRLEYAGKPPMVRIISDNPSYGSYERNIEGVEIIGRVVWFARKL